MQRLFRIILNLEKFEFNEWIQSPWNVTQGQSLHNIIFSALYKRGVLKSDGLCSLPL